MTEQYQQENINEQDNADSLELDSFDQRQVQALVPAGTTATIQKLKIPGPAMLTQLSWASVLAPTGGETVALRLFRIRLWVYPAQHDVHDFGGDLHRRRRKHRHLEQHHSRAVRPRQRVPRVLVGPRGGRKHDAAPEHELELQTRWRRRAGACADVYAGAVRASFWAVGNRHDFSLARNGARHDLERSRSRKRSRLATGVAIWSSIRNGKNRRPGNPDGSGSGARSYGTGWVR